MGTYFDRSVFLSIFLAATLLISLALFAIILGLALYSGRNFNLETDVLYRFMRRKDALLSKYEFKNFEEATEFCANLGKTLPLPKSKQDEQNLIDRINSVVGDSTDCSGFYLAYKQKRDPRYQSLDGNKTWPSVIVSPDVAKPSVDRDCLEFRFSPLTTVNILPCGEVNASCFVTFYRSDDCSATATAECHRLTISTTERATDIMSAMEGIEVIAPTSFGLVPIDEHFYPLTLDGFKPKGVDTCIALAVTDLYQYVSPDGMDMPYKSDRFVGFDAEHDCVGVTPGSDSIVASVTCDTAACVLCH